MFLLQNKKEIWTDEHQVAVATKGSQTSEDEPIWLLTSFPSLDF